MDKSTIKEQLMNELGDKLQGLEMDVTSSFLNGKICSPLLMTANNAAAHLQGTAANARNTLNKAGIYITKDGLNYDPTVMTEMAGEIVNSALNLTTSELVRLKDHALKEISYIPDPSIILNKAMSYFAYNLQHETITMDDILDFTNVSEKVEKINEERGQNVIDKVKKWVDNKIPPINDKITNISYNVNKMVNNVTYYMSFGPDWVMDEMTNIIGDGSYVAEQYVNEQIETINNWKLQQYDKAAYLMGQTMTQQYEKLVKQNLKELNDELEKNKALVKITAATQLQKVNLAIMAKTGIRIPIEKITPENYNKIKRNAKIAQFVQMAAQATPSNGPDSSNEQLSGETVTSVENQSEQKSLTTDPKYEKYSQEYFKGLHEGLRKLYDYASSLSRKYDRKARYGSATDEEEEYYYDMSNKFGTIAGQASNFSSQIEVYDRIDTEEFFHGAQRRKNTEMWGPWDLGENVDEFVKIIIDLLNETTITDKEGNLYSWDKEANDYVETSAGQELDNADTGQGNNNSVPEMYNQTFMDFTNTDNSNTEV